MEAPLATWPHASSNVNEVYRPHQRGVAWAVLLVGIVVFIVCFYAALGRRPP